MVPRVIEDPKQMLEYMPEVTDVTDEIMREGWGDKHYLRTPADRKAQISPLAEPTPHHWIVLCDLQIFSGSVCHLEQLHAQFLFPIVFGINNIQWRIWTSCTQQQSCSGIATIWWKRQRYWTQGHLQTHVLFLLTVSYIHDPRFAWVSTIWSRLGDASGQWKTIFGWVGTMLPNTSINLALALQKLTLFEEILGMSRFADVTGVRVSENIVSQKKKKKNPNASSSTLATMRCFHWPASGCRTSGPC